MFVSMFQVLCWAVSNFNTHKGGLIYNPSFWNDTTSAFLVFMISTVFIPYPLTFEFLVLFVFIVSFFIGSVFVGSLNFSCSLNSLLPSGVSFPTGLFIVISEIISLIFRPLALFARPAAHLFVYNVLFAKLYISNQPYFYFLFFILFIYEFIIISIQSYVVTVVLGFSSS